MNRFSDYKIVSGSDYNAVEQQVNELLKQGFIIIGGIESSFVPTEQKIYVFQAMVKLQEPVEKEEKWRR
jgi:hypothetical protein